MRIDVEVELTLHQRKGKKTMSHVETIDELAENLANEWYIYPTEADPEKRSEFVAEVADRLRQAAENEKLLIAYRRSSIQDFSEDDKPDKNIEAPELTYVHENYTPLHLLQRLRRWIKRLFRLFVSP